MSCDTTADEEGKTSWPDTASSLDPELAALIGEQAEDGSSITCIACSKFDHNKYRGTVKCSRGRLYTYQSFVNDHVKNMYHSHSVKRMRDDKIQADQYFHIHGKPRPEPKRKNQSSMSAFFTKKAKRTEPDQNLEEDSSTPNTLVEKGSNPGYYLPPAPATTTAYIRGNDPRRLNKSFCHGAFAMADHGNRVTQKGLQVKKELYSHVDPRFEIKLIPGSSILSVYSMDCTNENVVLRDINAPTKKGYKCIQCHNLCNANATWKKQLTKSMHDKGELHEDINLILTGRCSLDSKNAMNAIMKLNSTSPNFLNPTGQILRIKIRDLKKWRDACVVETPIKSQKFLAMVREHIEKHPEWEEQIEIDMLKHSMSKANGMKGAALHMNESTRMLWMTVQQKSAAGAKFLAANVNGPNNRTLRRTAAKIDRSTRQVSGNSIIDKTNSEAVEQLCEYARNHYSKYKKPTTEVMSMSYSIDATKNAHLISIHTPSQKVVGGAHPNHSIDIPDGDEKLYDLIEMFKDPKNTVYKYSSEIKLATVVMQNAPDGESPMYQLIAQPQTINMSSGFNERVCRRDHAQS